MLPKPTDHNCRLSQLISVLRRFGAVFSRDSKIMASASDDCTIRLWDVAAGQCCRTLHGHSRWVESVAFSHDSKLLVSGSADLTVKLWDVTLKQELITLKGHKIQVNTVVFTPDGNNLVTASGDGTVRLWAVPGK